MTRLRILLLGGLNVDLDGKPAPLRYDKLRALLARLAAEPRPHTRAELVGLLWPDAPEADARHNLSQALLNLRKALGDGVVAAGRDSVQLNSNAAWIDLHEFERLRASAVLDEVELACDLYAGEFLAHFSLDNNEHFEEWVTLRREQCHRKALDAMAKLAGMHESTGNFAGMAEIAQRQIALEPWREEAHLQRMHALSLAGDRAAALQQYEECRRVLAAELGIEPSPEVTTFAEAIRKGDVTRAGKPVAPIAEQRHIKAALPAALTPFVGRERELATLTELIADPDARLITLVGLGGMGKTRLALQAAVTTQAQFEDGAGFVPLEAVKMADQQTLALLQALNISLSGAASPEQQLIDVLRDRNMLIVLDNYEQLLQESGNALAMLANLLQTAPRIKLLVTSREPLGMHGEWVFRLDGLGEAAGVLFMQSAQRANPAYRFDASDQHHLERICKSVAGIPLGIELAASWVSTLSLEEIAAEIDQGEVLLRNDWQLVPARQRSMRAVLDHSWQRLSAEEQRMLAGLSVFNGSFTRDMAQRIAGATLTTLSKLVANSLLRRAGSQRYALHEVMRQFAFLMLQEMNLIAPMQRRHAEAFLALAESAQGELHGAQALPARQRMTDDLANFRAALEFASQAEDPAGRDVYLRLCAALARLWYLLPEWAEGTRHLSQAIERAGDANPHTLACVRLGHGVILGAQAHLDDALTQLALALQAFESAGDRWQVAWTQYQMAHVHYMRERFDLALPLANASLAGFDAIGDAWGRALLTFFRSDLAWATGDYATASTMAAESLGLFAAMGDRHGECLALHVIGDVALMQGQYADARQNFMASLGINQQLDNLNSLGWDSQRLGELALLEGDADGALAWLKQAAAMRDKTGDRLGTCAALEGLAFALMMKRDVNAIRLIAAADARRPDSDSLLVEPLRAGYAAGIQRIRNMVGDQAWTAQVALGRHATVQQLLSAMG